MILSPRSLRAAASNVTHKLVYGHVADLRPMPTVMIEDGPEHAVHRYRGPEGLIAAGPPVLFVPPPGAPARCYDLRRGCSLAEHVVTTGRRSYLLDCGPAGYTGREPGLAEWVGRIVPRAVRAVSEDAGGQPVQLVGWCLGGMVSLLTAAADPGLPIASVAAIATPAGPRPAGGFGPLAKRAYRGVGLDKYVARPYSILTNLNNAEFLAQIEAVDQFTTTMLAHPGRTTRQLYSVLSREGSVAEGIEIGGRRVRLSDVRVPVLAIAGRGDTLAPAASVHPLTRVLTGAERVRFELAPGGHLGVLTGRSARSSTWSYLDRWLDEGIVRHGIRPSRKEFLPV
ncbi:alpha/beta hydrolase [Actinomadura fulvescens]|uniref:Alpha/beta hydrolase n=1 Tax=Actinomadura fulvescens TaxID=46160 RepID=A0ABN3PLR5_9ACTN